MRTFMAAFMALIVSGDDETMITITGVLEDSVLLPCNCSDTNLEFKWQMEEPNTTLMLKYSKNTKNFFGRYTGRAEIFLLENSNNCSLLLTNITADDLGKYRCSFYSKGIYKKAFVYLNIFASYNVCKKEDLSLKVFQCDVEGRYKEAEIQWNLDGQLLTDSPTTRITHANTPDAPSGLYHFTSKLITKLNGTSRPVCDVKAKGVSTIITSGCAPETGPWKTDPNRRYRYLQVIPVVLVLGFSLVLWCRQTLSQRGVEGSGD